MTKIGNKKGPVRTQESKQTERPVITAIRQAALNDMETLGRLEEAVFGDRRKMESIFIAVREKLCFITYCGEMPAGFATLDRLDGSDSHIGVIAVLPEYRRIGVASAMLSKISAVIPSGTVLYGATAGTNTAMRAVFEKNGFKLLNRKPSVDAVYVKY
jgi:ribosomal protein S18 acetylase RimI-like enzyme